MVNVKLIMFLLLLVLIPVASALTCEYDDKPLFSNDINWLCSIAGNETYKCYSYTMYEGDLLHVYPTFKYIDNIGVVDYYTGNMNVIINFGKEDLYEGYNYTFGVVCSSLDSSNIKTFNASVLPVYSELRTLPYKVNWFKANLGYILGIIIIWVLIIIVWRIIT